jgi:hypothetical protein
MNNPSLLFALKNCVSQHAPLSDLQDGQFDVNIKAGEGGKDSMAI